eukprot:scaffold37540_cov28-Tisochrysis_lutea.AAC.5
MARHPETKKERGRGAGREVRSAGARAMAAVIRARLRLEPREQSEASRGSVFRIGRQRDREPVKLR